MILIGAKLRHLSLRQQFFNPKYHGMQLTEIKLFNKFSGEDTQYHIVQNISKYADTKWLDGSVSENVVCLQFDLNTNVKLKTVHYGLQNH